MNWSEHFTRATAQAQMAAMHLAFFDHFESNGYMRQQSARTIDAADYDKSTRFIGSHITVLKPALLTATLSQEGVCIQQTGFSTKNLRAFQNPGQSIDRTSVFEGQGLVAHYYDLERVIRDTISYFQALGIAEDVIYQIHDTDNDLIEAISKVAPAVRLEVGTLPRAKTIHEYGDSRLQGRDIRIEIDGPKGRVASAVIIALSIDDVPQYIEVTLSPARVLEKIYNLSHSLDTFPFNDTDKKVDQEVPWRKMEDVLIGATHLTREGLKPGGSGNQRQLLKKYFGHLSALCGQLDIDKDQLEQLISFHEKARYGDNTCTGKIIDYTNN